MFRIGPIDQHSIFDAPPIAAWTSGFDAWMRYRGGCCSSRGTALLRRDQQCHGRSGVALPAAWGWWKAPTMAWGGMIRGNGGHGVAIFEVDRGRSYEEVIAFR